MQSLTKPIVEGKFMGINDSTPSNDPSKMNGFLVKADNAFVTDRIKKVFGSTAIAPTISTGGPPHFTGLAPFELIDVGTKYLVAAVDGATNSQLYAWSGSGSFTPIGSANLTNDQHFWFETANNILYGFNGIEVVSWDGTTVTKNPATVPLGFYGKWWHNYLFVGNTATTPNRVSWSNLGDPTTFTGTNFVDINPGDSDQITGIAGFPGQDELLVFKRQTIWSVSGFSGTSFSSTTIATQNTNARIVGYGCVSPFSIVVAGNDCYYFSMLGGLPVIRSLTKTINAITLDGGVISSNISATMGNININQLHLITSVFDGRYIYWAVPTGANTYNSQLIVLDTWRIGRMKGHSGEIYPFTTMSGKKCHFLTVSTIPGHSQVYFADDDPSETGLVFKFDTSVYTDNGVPITMDVRTRDYQFDLARKSHWKYMPITYETGSAASVAVNARIDQALNFTNQDNISMAGNSPPLGQFILGQSTLGGAGITTKRVNFKQMVGHMLGLQLLESSASPVNIDYFELYGIMKGLRNS